MYTLPGMLLQLVYKVEHKLLDTHVVLLTVYKLPGMLLQLGYKVEHKLLNNCVVLHVYTPRDVTAVSL